MKKMIFSLLLLGFSITGLQACPICNPDGGESGLFIIWVIGGGITGMFFFLLWSIASGHYQMVENPKERIVKLDQGSGVKL
jgi:nitrogen fixation-related uncharacterized protein